MPRFIVEELPSCDEREFNDIDEARAYAKQCDKEGESDTVRLFELIEEYSKT